MYLSCEDMQDTDLELGLDNSSFYDQFAIAQVRVRRMYIVIHWVDILDCTGDLLKHLQWTWKLPALV